MIHPASTWSFLILLLVACGLTFAAARRNRSGAEFLNAGGHLGAGVNGIAISAEFTSAASLLGVIALLFEFGADALIYLTSTALGFAFVTFAMAERYRALGRVTMGDVFDERFRSRRLRLLSAAAALLVLAGYLVTQIASGGHLLNAIFGSSYTLSVLVIGGMSGLFVVVGGMLAATWIQLIKALLFVAGLVALSLAVLWGADWDLTGLIEAAERGARSDGEAWMQPGVMLTGPMAAISLALTMTFGIAGLPHILVRFCTVPDAVTARRSMAVATAIVCVVVATYLIVALGAVANLADREGAGANVIFLDFIRAVGGDITLGLAGSAILATIIAVVAGMVIAVSSTVVCDIFGGTSGDGKRNLLISRLAAVGAIVFALLLAYAFRDARIGYLLTLAFSIAASACFPVLLLTLHWSRLTEAGAFYGLLTGLMSTVALIAAGPNVAGDLIGTIPLFPIREPTVVAMPLTFVVAMVVSIAKARRPVELLSEENNSAAA